MKYKCDCESSYCEKGNKHIAGKCENEAKFYATVYGINQRLCERCFDVMCANVPNKHVTNVYAIIEDKEY